MIIAHLPGGYIIGRLLEKIESSAIRQKRIMQVALIGSVLPDLDMLYFYWVNRTSDHHLFVSHIPAYYCALLPLVILGRVFSSFRYVGNLALTLWVSLMLHAVLDTVVSGILWTFPFVEAVEENLIHIVDKDAIPRIVDPYKVYVELFGMKLEGWVLNVLLH